MATDQYEMDTPLISQYVHTGWKAGIEHLHQNMPNVKEIISCLYFKIKLIWAIYLFVLDNWIHSDWIETRSKYSSII